MENMGMGGYQIPIVITEQPEQNPSTVVFIQSERKSNSAPKWVLLLSLITLFCCPESFICTIPACICAFSVLDDNDRSRKKMLVWSLVATGLFWISLIIGLIVTVVFYATGVVPSPSDY